ncbi:MAG: alpha/beta hydrolase [Novosphingobium sp.]
MRVRFADIAGIRTRYYEAGSGRPVLLVHGGGAASDTWVRNIETIASRYRVIAPDLVGHGFSDAIDLEGKVPQQVQVQHLRAVIEALDLNGVALVGHSFGGLVASLLYLKYPELIEVLGLISSSSAFHPPAAFGTAVGNAYENQIASLTDPSLERLRARNVGSNFKKEDTFEEILLLQLTYMGLPDRKRAFEQMHYGLLDSASSKEHRVYHRLEDLKLPTFVLTGREDPRAKWQIVEEGAKRIADCEFHIVEQSGHKPFSEQSDEFNTLLLDFLDRRFPA